MLRTKRSCRCQWSVIGSVDASKRDDEKPCFQKEAALGSKADTPMRLSGRTYGQAIGPRMTSSEIGKESQKHTAVIRYS